jgi:hypothetical protein
VFAAGVHREAGQGAAGERGAQVAPAESARDELRGRWLVGAASFARGPLPGLSRSSSAANASGFYSPMPVDKRKTGCCALLLLRQLFFCILDTQIKSFAQLLLCKIYTSREFYERQINTDCSVSFLRVTWFC